jgi:cellobiose-specific phosphotransferase system component IIB
MVRQEIRHSSFLAFLLNPSASHRMGDIFLKTFLKRLLVEANNATVSPIEVDIADLADTEVRREWRNIDILLVSPTSQIVCAIENKVDSGEHSDQLQRYRKNRPKGVSLLSPHLCLPHP